MKVLKNRFILPVVALWTIILSNKYYLMFQQIKPVRDSMTEALQLWKKIAGKGEDAVSDDLKASSQGKHFSNIFFYKMNLQMSNLYFLTMFFIINI